MVHDQILRASSYTRCYTSNEHGLNEPAIDVHVYILEAPPTTMMMSRNRSSTMVEGESTVTSCLRQRRKRRLVVDDPYAMVYVHPSMCVRLSAIVGRTVCYLSRTPLRCDDDDDDDNGCVFVPVTLCIWDEISKENSSRIYVPPCVAASAGLFQFELEKNGGESLGVCGTIQSTVYSLSYTIDPDVGPTNTFRDEYTVAYGVDVRIREIGACVTNPTFAKLESVLQRRLRLLECNVDDEQNIVDDVLKEYFSTPKLLAKGVIFAILHNSATRFFLLECIHCKQNELAGKPASSFHKPYVVSSKVSKLILITNNAREKNHGLVRRLPRISSTESFTRFILNKCNQKSIPPFITNEDASSFTLTSDSRDVSKKLADSLLSNIPYFVDSREICPRKIIEKTCDIMGCRVLFVDGLSSFYHRHNSHHSRQRRISGSTLDKVFGIKAAFEIARLSAPCAIAFTNIDTEFSSVSTKVGEMVTNVEVDEGRILSTLRAEFQSSFVDTLNQNFMFSSPVHLICTTSQDVPRSCIETFPTATIVEYKPSYVLPKELAQSPQIVSVLESCDFRTKDSIIRYSRPILSEENSESWHLVVCALKKLLQSGPLSPNHVNITTNNSIPDVSWEDIGGLANVRNEIVDALDFPLKYPHLYKYEISKNEAGVPKFRENSVRRSGLIMYGPPGTGKTLCAKAVASECRVPFISIKGPELLGSYVGESEKNIRNAFTMARNAADSSPKCCAVLFFDEIDSIAPKRGGTGDGGGVMDRVVATLLGELDNNITNDGGYVFVIGATNRPDLLDPSLYRQGRLDRLVFLGLATEPSERIKIMIALMRKFSFENGIHAESMAEQLVNEIPPNLSGADFSAITSGAFMQSLGRLCRQIERDSKNEGKPLDDYMRSLHPEQLIPIITKKDLMKAAQNVIPSVSPDTAEYYNSLRVRFSS